MPREMMRKMAMPTSASTSVNPRLPAMQVRCVLLDCIGERIHWSKHSDGKKADGNTDEHHKHGFNNDRKIFGHLFHFLLIKFCPLHEHAGQVSRLLPDRRELSNKDRVEFLISRSEEHTSELQSHVNL